MSCKNDCSEEPIWFQYFSSDWIKEKIENKLFLFHRIFETSGFGGEKRTDEPRVTAVGSVSMHLVNFSQKPILKACKKTDFSKKHPPLNKWCWII